MLQCGDERSEFVEILDVFRQVHLGGCNEEAQVRSDIVQQRTILFPLKPRIEPPSKQSDVHDLEHEAKTQNNRCEKVPDSELGLTLHRIDIIAVLGVDE